MRSAKGRMQERSLLSDFAQLGLACIDSSMDYWSRSWEIVSRYFKQASVDAFGAGVGSPYVSGDIFQGFTREYRNYVMEMAVVPWLAAERFGAELGEVDHAESGPRERTWSIQNKPVMLPVRIRDASQGVAIYAVSASLVQKTLDAKHEPFRALELGRGRTPLVIFIMHYREGDLGTHDELGIAFLVTPKHDPSAMPGVYLRAAPVNEAFTYHAGREIWGYRKTVMKGLTFEYAGKRACCILREGGHELLTISLPRSGSGSSTAIPIPTYTLIDHIPHRTIFLRSGRGEYIRAGGHHVELTLGADKDLGLGRDDDDLGHTLRLLRTLGLPQRSPLLHAWTEHMSGEFGIPYALQ
jgi:Acetoacetate decarboxylase (ADC)